MENSLLEYDFGNGARAFTTGRDAQLPCHVIQPHQTHSDRIVCVRNPGMTRDELEGVDALVTSLEGVAIGVRTADCIPVLLYDPVVGAVGAVHSGWRGTVKNISARTVGEMIRLFCCSPSDIRAVIGPGIGYESFQVGEEVVAAFRDAGHPLERIWSYRKPAIEGTMEGGHHIDLKECVRISLLECGLLDCNINISNIDTYTDRRFYSARREGTSCGRNINAILISGNPRDC